MRSSNSSSRCHACSEGCAEANDAAVPAYETVLATERLGVEFNKRSLYVLNCILNVLRALNVIVQWDRIFQTINQSRRELLQLLQPLPCMLCGCAEANGTAVPAYETPSATE
jgi:hypothetical protein